MTRLLLLLVWAAALPMSAASLAEDPIHALLCRVLPRPGDAERFCCQVEPGPQEQFTIACDGRQISVSGSSRIAVATGINWYLQHYAGVDISWNSPTATLPSRLPRCAAETHTASVPWRYYLNFCTHSYSMAFWDWQRWQQELDWMALHGVNMPLTIVGMEAVWRRVLTDAYGYRGLPDVSAFVAGSAYLGWFFMNNLTAWGGPQPESWYAGREALARKIFGRMAELGMSPVVPGYVGMVPSRFLDEAGAGQTAGWQAADIVDGGTWCAFGRPAFVDNTARLREFAARYYAAFHDLYGDVCSTHFYAIDPFHEGGVPPGVTDAQASVRAMWQALQAYDPEAVWVAQHWQDNPTPILTHTLPQGRLIILDLHGDQGADTSCSGHHTTADGAPHDWVWGQVSNFGGNVGLFGRLERLIGCFYAARDSASANRLVGIGALPEGIENNPMLYDLLYALPWTRQDYTRQTWLADYVGMRYGLPPTARRTQAYRHLLSAWTRLAASVYSCPNDAQQGTTESVLLMRPALKAATVSSWAASSWYWNPQDVRDALADMLAARRDLHSSDNYRYDLVDVTRQALADHGKLLLDSIAGARGAERDALADRFLQLILDQDRLLATRPELRLGRWTAMARALGTTEAEQDLYERNARMLLTTWGDRAQCENGGLHDYANREWQGLLAAYYYPRWKAFFRRGCTALRWFDDFEWPFVQGDDDALRPYLPPGVSDAYGTFSAEAEGDEITTAMELSDKYFH